MSERAYSACFLHCSYPNCDHIWMCPLFIAHLLLLDHNLHKAGMTAVTLTSAYSASSTKPRTLETLNKWSFVESVNGREGGRERERDAEGRKEMR